MIQTPAARKMNAIFNLANEYMHPRGVEMAMRKNMFSQIKLQNRILTRNELGKLKTYGTNDAYSLARSISQNIADNAKKFIKKIVHFIMELKLSDAEN